MPDRASRSTSSGARSRCSFSRVAGAFEIWPEPDLILIVGGLLCIVGVVVLDTAVEVDELGPGQQRLELVEDETVLALGLIGLAAARAVGLRSLALLGLSFGGAGLDARMLRHGPTRRRSGQSATARKGR